MVLSHEQARKLIHIQVSNALTKHEQAQLEQHLVGCAECRVYQANSLTLRESLQRRWPTSHRAEHDLAGVLARLEKPGRVIPIPQFAMGALAVLAIVLVGLYAILNLSPVPEPSLAELPTFTPSDFTPTAPVTELLPTPVVVVVDLPTHTPSPLPPTLEQAPTTDEPKQTATATEPVPEVEAIPTESMVAAGAADMPQTHWSTCLSVSTPADNPAKDVLPQEYAANLTGNETVLSQFLDGLNAYCHNGMLVHGNNRSLALVGVGSGCYGAPPPYPGFYEEQEQARINELLEKNMTVILIECWPPRP